MRPLLLDTNAYTAMLAGDAATLEALAHAERLLMSPVVLGELLGGFAAGSREASNRALLSAFLDTPRVQQVAITTATADSYALVYAGLRRKGQPIPSNDLWIAASALEHGAALLTRDGHFAHVEGLRFGAQLQEFLP